MKKITSILMCLAAACIFAACAKSQTALEGADDFVSAIKAYDFIKAERYYSGNLPGLESFGITDKQAKEALTDKNIKAIADRILSVDYLLTQREAEKDGKAVVELSFKTYDYLTLAADTAVRLTKDIALSGKKPDSDEFRDMFIALFREKISKADAATDVVLNMYMEKEKDGWKITKIEDSNGNITKMYNSIYSMYKMAQ